MLRAAPRWRASPAGRCGRSSSSGCGPTERPVSPVVGEHPLPVGLLRELGRPARSARAAARAGCSPPPEPGRLRAAATSPSCQSSSRRGAEAVAGARGDERLERGAVDRRALREVGDVGRTARARPTTASASSSPTDLHVPEPDPHGAVLDQRTSPPLRFTSGGRTSTPRRCAVADEARRRVEAHRLRVQERARGTRPGSGGAARPTGRRAARTRPSATSGTRSPRSRRACRRRGSRAPRRRPCRARPRRTARGSASSASCAALAAHRAAQPLRLADGEPGERHRDLEHLVLEDDDAERLAQRLARASGWSTGGT